MKKLMYNRRNSYFKRNITITSYFKFGQINSSVFRSVCMKTKHMDLLIRVNRKVIQINGDMDGYTM